MGLEEPARELIFVARLKYFHTVAEVKTKFSRKN